MPLSFAGALLASTDGSNRKTRKMEEEKEICSLPCTPYSCHHCPRNVPLSQQQSLVPVLSSFHHCWYQPHTQRYSSRWPLPCCGSLVPSPAGGGSKLAGFADLTLPFVPPAMGITVAPQSIYLHYLKIPITTKYNTV